MNSSFLIQIQVKLLTFPKNLNMKKFTWIYLLSLLVVSCSQPVVRKVPLVGFLDFIEDPTIALAKKGFLDALKINGFSEADSTMQFLYSNAQGDIPTLGQSCDLLISKKCDLIAANVTLSTITAVQRTKTIPVFMMVSPRPDLAKLTDDKGNAPSNLFGVYETLDYIDTAINIITELDNDIHGMFHRFLRILFFQISMQGCQECHYLLFGKSMLRQSI